MEIIIMFTIITEDSLYLLRIKLCFFLIIIMIIIIPQWSLSQRGVSLTESSTVWYTDHHYDDIIIFTTIIFIIIIKVITFTARLSLRVKLSDKLIIGQLPLLLKRQPFVNIVFNISIVPNIPLWCKCQILYFKRIASILLFLVGVTWLGFLGRSAWSYTEEE